MTKRIRLLPLFFFIIIFGSYQNVYAAKKTDVLSCEYDAQPIDIQVSMPTGDINNPVNNTTKTLKITGTYSANLTVTQEFNHSSLQHNVIVYKGSKENKEKLLNWTELEEKNKIKLNPVQGQVTADFACPKFLGINFGGMGAYYVVAGNDAKELHEYGEGYGELNKKYYILTLKNQIRDEKDTCFYHRESSSLTTIREELSVFYNKSTRKIVSLPVRGLPENNYKGEACPAAMYQEQINVNEWVWKIIETEEEAKKIYNSKDKNRLLLNYKIDGNTLQGSDEEKEKIKELLIKYTKEINNDLDDYKERYVTNKDSLTSVEKNTCMERKKTPKSKWVYSESKKELENAIQLGIPETDEVIVNLKNAMARYEKLIQDIVEKSSSLYCEYESKADSKYMIIEKNCPEKSDSAICSYKFKLYDSKSSMNLLHEYSQGEIKAYGSDYCFQPQIIYQQNDFDFKCYENLYYDIDDEKVKFASTDMVSKLKAGMEWDKKFTLIGAKQSEEVDSLFENATPISDLSSIKIYNNGFMFNDNSSCIDPLGGNIECEDIFDEETKEFISFIYFVIVIAAIVLTIIMSVKDYAGVIINGDQDGIKKSNGKLIKRLLLVILLLLLPAIIKFVLNIFDIPFFNSDNPTCGVQINK